MSVRRFAVPFGSFAALVAFAAIANIASGCGQTALPPHGEALFYVDTDLPVPALASRLRVDLYAEDGTWFESRDVSRADPADWPASFGVYSSDDSRDVRVLVRMRAYPEGIVRDYAGERFHARPTFTEPKVASDLTELCASAPELPLGGRITLRRGGKTLTDVVPQQNCVSPQHGGSVAARFHVTTPGHYRFDVANANPFYADMTLFVRRSCNDVASQIVCDSETRPGLNDVPGHFPRADAFLDPGNYTVMTGGTHDGFPADITLESTPLDDAGPLPPVNASSPALPNAPRLVHAGANASDNTPATEPVPSAAIDRLVVVRLHPGDKGAARIVLHGACAGTMSKLGADPSSPDLATALTCVDTENVLAAPEEIALDPSIEAPPSSASGTFGAQHPCDPSESTSRSICVPGGAFVLGSRVQTSFTNVTEAATPERIALMQKFFVDRYEVTVKDVRDAMAKGFVPPPNSIMKNDGALTSGSVAGNCTYSTTPLGREDYAVSCVSWTFAHALCQFRGGDLPTEAQWEYAATAAGRTHKTLYPWGDDAPTCDRAVYGRAKTGAGDVTCSALGAHPLPTTAVDGHDGNPGDVTPLGIVNLGGGVLEWTLDSAQSYDGDCWGAAGLVDPRCWEENAPTRSLRGGSWIAEMLPSAAYRPASSGAAGASEIEDIVPAQTQAGFRCAYAGSQP
jgi:formylglycine-generating enzyme required for sulfatase activity